MIETLKSGGVWIIPIILCGVIATFIIIERTIYFISLKKKDAQLMENLKEPVKARDFQAVDVACAAAGTPTAKVLHKAVKCRNMAGEDFKEEIETEMNAVIPEFEHLLTALGTIANISTLLGLLGTVTGNIKAFGVLSSGGSMGDPAALAGAIAEALVTTAAGLIVSIPSIIAHNFFVSRVNRNITRMETNVTHVTLAMGHHA